MLIFNQQEEKESSSQLDSDPEGPYITENFNIPITFPEQSIKTFENNMIIEQSYKTKKILLDHITETVKYKTEPEWWNEQISSSSPLPMVLEQPRKTKKPS